MQDDIPKSWIAIMPMRVPAARSQVHFHISRLCGLFSHLHNRCAKIRTPFQIEKPRVQNSNRLAIESLKLISQQPLVLPDCLQQALRGRRVVFLKYTNDAAAHSPFRIEVIQDRRHLGSGFAA